MKIIKKIVFIFVVLVSIIAIAGIYIFMLFKNDSKKETKPTETPIKLTSEQKEAYALETAKNNSPEQSQEYKVIEKKERKNKEIEYILENTVTGERETYVVEEDGSIYLEIKTNIFSGTEDQ